VADRGRAAQARAGPVGSDGPRRACHLCAAVGRYRGRPPRHRADAGDRRLARHRHRHRRPVRGAGRAGDHRRCLRRRRRPGDRDVHPPPRVDRRGQPGRHGGRLRPDLKAGQHRIGHRTAAADVRHARSRTVRRVAALVARRTGLPRRRCLGTAAPRAWLAAVSPVRRAELRRRRLSRARRRPAGDRH